MVVPTAHDAGTGRALRFNVGAFPVRIQPAFLVVVALLGVDPADPDPVRIASWVAVATISVLIHELGHAVAFRVYGRHPSIVLHGLGGLTSAAGGLSPARSIVVSLAGPLAALVLLGVPALWLQQSDVVAPGLGEVLLAQAVWITVGWSLLNLLPVLPLDGGHVVEAVADLLTRGRGRRIAVLASILVAAAAGLAAAAWGLLFAALIAGVFVAINVGQLTRLRNDEAFEALRHSARALLAGDATTAEREVGRAVQMRPRGQTLRLALDLRAWALLLAGDVAAARNSLRSEDEGAPSPHLVAALFAVEGSVGQAVTTFAFALEPRAGAQEPPGADVQARLAVEVMARLGLVRAVASELVALGAGGIEGARNLAALLEAVGRPGEAFAVRRMAGD